MQIAFVVDRCPPRPHSSIGLFVYTMARGLRRRGHQVTVVDLGESKHEEVHDGVRIVTLRRSSLSYVGNLITRLRIRRWLQSRAKAGDVEVIEVPEYPGLLPFGVGSIPVVVRLHQSATATSHVNGLRRAPGIYYYERSTLANNRNWIGVSHHILTLTKQTFRIAPKRSTVIYNPLLPIPPVLPEVMGLPANYVLFVGEVCRRKGVLVLAEAARRFLEQRGDLYLLYVGAVFHENGRPVSDEILETVGSKLATRVQFLGYLRRDDVLACMAQARVFAFPSLHEAFGLVVAEAMACGVPVVCMSSGPGPELVEHGVTGLLADPTSPGDFNEKICRILDDPLLGDRLSNKARDGVLKRFSLDSCLEATERFYAECLERGMAS